MRFLYPAGLWALMGVPLLILVYLFKPKHEDRIVSSTFLWKLSERFRKKQIPAQRLKKILVFLLQLLMIITGSLLIAQPRIALKGAGVDYIAILDVSGSMRITGEDGVSRFDNARQSILDYAKRLDFGSAMTVLTADAETARLAERTQSFEEVRSAVSRAVCGWGNGDITSAMAAAQALVWAHPNAQVYLYTDKDYAETERVTVVNVATTNEWNVAITGMTAALSGTGTTFTSTIVSYGKGAPLTMALYVDGALQAARIVDCPNGEAVAVSWQMDGVYEFGSAKVLVEAEDGLREDNEYWLFNRPANSIRALLISEKPFYVRNVLGAYPAVSLHEALSPEEADSGGYDLYIYDGLLPKILPEDGAVWLINPPAAPAGWNIGFGEEIMGGSLSPAREFDDDIYSVLTRNLQCRDVSILQFREVQSSGSFAPVLLCGDLPVVLAGRSEAGARRMLLMFDLHDSNLPLLTDYVFLIGNMLDYSTPAMLEIYAYDAGTPISAKVLPFCEEVFLQTPADGILRIPFDTTHADFSASRPGVYTLLQKLTNGSAQYCDFYAHMPFAEGNTAPAIDPRRLAFSVDPAVSAEAAAGQDGEEGTYNPLPLLEALLLLILIIECVVYNREQF